MKKESSCDLTGFESAKELYTNFLKCSLQNSTNGSTDKECVSYLFNRGLLCPYCDTKLYSYRHINEHLSFEHNAHIELEELVFFVPDEFKTWKKQTENRLKANYDDYMSPVSLVPLKSVPKKTYYRCRNNVKLLNNENTFVCPSSLETYMDGDILRASFWRSHLCENLKENGSEPTSLTRTSTIHNVFKPTSDKNINYQLDGANSNTSEDPKRKLYELHLPTPEVKHDQQTLSTREVKESQKLELKKLTKRILQTDLTDIDPCFDETLSKVIPVLNNLLDKHDITTIVKTKGKPPFIYYPSSDEESLSDTDNESNENSFSEQTTKKRILQLDNNYNLDNIIKKKSRCDKNRMLNWGVCANGEMNVDDNLKGELYIHSGFDHDYL